MKPSDTPEIVWSNTDYPYICLIDKKRTLAFRDAIYNTVKPGDHVLEIGAGTGILSLFAAEAGAEKVTAVEIDHVLAKYLRQTIKLNGLEDKIHIISANALEADLPKNVDVVIAELIETGLLDEMQVSVMNDLHKRESIGSNTKVVPKIYETHLQLVYVDSTFYGYNIVTPKHNWPYYSEDNKNWAQLKVKQVSEIKKVGEYNFQSDIIDPTVDQVLEFSIQPGYTANAVKLSGLAHLNNKIKLGACNTFNGDKILHLQGSLKGQVKLRVHYTMGSGLDNFSVREII